jgi:hypothetical protein
LTQFIEQTPNIKITAPTLTGIMGAAERNVSKNFGG